MSEHTPLPWQVDGEGVRAFVRGADLTIVATRHRLPAPLHQANAAFIVKAVNNHADLVACVQASLNMVDGDGLPPDWDFLRQILAKVS